MGRGRASVVSIPRYGTVVCGNETEVPERRLTNKREKKIDKKACTQIKANAHRANVNQRERERETVCERQRF